MGGRCSSAAPGLCMSVERFGCVFIFSHNFHTRFSIVCVSSFAERDFFVPYSFRKRYPLLSAVQEKFQELWPQAQHYTITLTGTQCQTSRQSNRFLAVCICDPEHQPPVPFFANWLHQRVCGSDVWKKNAVTEVQLSFQQQRF